MQDERDHQSEAPPPVGGTWNRVYAFVLIWLAVQIAFYFAFTRFFS